MNDLQGTIQFGGVALPAKRPRDRDTLTRGFGRRFGGRMIVAFLCLPSVMIPDMESPETLGRVAPRAAPERGSHSANRGNRVNRDGANPADRWAIGQRPGCAPRPRRPGRPCPEPAKRERGRARFDAYWVLTKLSLRSDIVVYCLSGHGKGLSICERATAAC